MNTEQREEIERLLNEIEKLASPDRMPHASGAIWAAALLPLAQFARQQLNLRVDWEKFAANNGNLESDWDLTLEDVKRLHSLVLECLTTTPEEKE